MNINELTQDQLNELTQEQLNELYFQHHVVEIPQDVDYPTSEQLSTVDDELLWQHEEVLSELRYNDYLNRDEI